MKRLAETLLSLLVVLVLIAAGFAAVAIGIASFGEIPK